MAATISTALLFPQARIPRAPQEAWAARLAGRLERCRALREVRALSLEVAGIANNAALIAAHRGDAGTARRLCEAQIRWQRRLARRSGDSAVAARALQPYVNLGRLEAALGAWPAALERFARLHGIRADGALELECLCVAAGAWESVAATPAEYEAFLETVYVGDSLKALLLNRRFAEAEAFAFPVEASPVAGLDGLATEARVVATCRLGDFAGARAQAAAASEGSRGWGRAVFRLRAAETLACAGEAQSAEAALRSLAGVVRGVSPAALRELSTLYVVVRLAAACAEAGLREDTFALARAAHEGARAADDEAIQIELLHLLAPAAPAAERAEWEDALSRAEERTGYARYRRTGPPLPDPVVDGVFARLTEIFAS